MKKLASIKNKIVPLTFFAGLLLIWEFVVEKAYIPKYILPSPSDVISVLIQILPALQLHIYTTLQEALLGLLLAIIFALMLAVVMDNVPVVQKALYPLVVVSQTIPIIALAPLFVIWFGFGILPKIIVVVLVCFFPILISLLEGLNSVDIEMLNLLKSMGANRIQIFKLVKFPASLVSFFSGLRIAATYSIMGAVIGEWLGGENGLGVYMIRVKHSYALDKVFAIIAIIVLLSLLIFKVIALIQKVLMPWNNIKKEI